jgi:hypothetical protein
MTRLTAILALTACLAAAEGVQWVEPQLDSRFGDGSTRQAPVRWEPEVHS